MAEIEPGTIVVSAPGKIILHGEHAVVYGKLALACSLNLRTFLKLKPTKNEKIVLTLANLSVCRRWTIKEIEESITFPFGNAQNPAPPTAEQLATLKNFLKIPLSSVDNKSLGLVAFMYLLFSITYKKGKTLPSIYICISSDVPVSAGLGSSAAYSVCLSSAFLTFSGDVIKPVTEQSKASATWAKKDLKLINAWALEADKIIHGTASGIDNTICTYGMAVTYKEGKLELLRRLPPLRILLIDTKIPRSTQALVTHVRQRYEKMTAIISPIFDSIEAVTQMCQSVLQEMGNEDDENKYKILEDMIDINQHHLNVLGVGHASLDKIQQITGRFGFHSKLTGAGGGGCSITLIKPGTPFMLVEMLKEELQREQFECFETTLAVPGISFYEKLDDTVKLPPNLMD